MFPITDPKQHAWLIATWMVGPFLHDGLFIDLGDYSNVGWEDLKVAVDSVTDKVWLMGRDISQITWSVTRP